uniref:Peptidase M13 C-terminal domain-containing protein n=1 Tax=Caenorhabditis japonica TaxID=281687 RepID=A0A8R1E0Z9_CAEJA
MVKILSDWIEQTPWLENYDIKNYVQRLTSEIRHVDDMAIVLENDIDELMREEINFLKCVHEVGDDGELFCLLYLREFMSEEYKLNYYSKMNAFNDHPRVGFGYPLYHVAKDSEMSAKFGFVGLIVGHEIAHTLIEDPNNRKLMPVFSAEAIQCIQDQYNATCEEFREDEYIKLNKLSITHQQIFFYAAAYTFCSGQENSAYPLDPHNTGNVRINALAQLPAFQEAFQCKPDSRMMKTVKSCLAYDFIRDSLKVINQDSDPCNDFYRHACPLGRYKSLVDTKFESLEQEFLIQQNPRIWKSLNIQKAVENVKISEVPKSSLEYIVQYYKNSCEQKKNTTSILKKIEELVLKSKTKECVYDKCFTILADDTNCFRSASFLKERLQQSPKFRTSEINTAIFGVKQFIKRLKLDIGGISFALGSNVLEGVDQVKTFIQEMVKILSDWIEQTPWLENYDIKNYVQHLTSEIRHVDDMAIVLENDLDDLMREEINFLKCVHEVGDDGELFCLLYLLEFMPNAYALNYYPKMTAFNAHPRIGFGYPLYHVAKNSEMSAKLGFVGLIVGHEIAHTLIEDPNSSELMPVFSTEAIKCIQDQYNATCEEFREESCIVADFQIDENGADVLGAQLAYKLFENYYGEKAKDEYIKLNKLSITHQQMFFYATAYTLCSGQQNSAYLGDTHNTGNVRINALAQLTAFQEAFQCKPDSRMMKTVKQTPWLENYDMKNYVQRLTSEIRHVDDMAIVLENDLDELMREEINFLKCVHEVGDDGELFCLLYLREFMPREFVRRYHSVMKAFNRHPRVSFGYPFYHVANNSEMSAKFGFVGFVVGHEIAHTLIEDPNSRKLMPVFSAEAIECIQDQYNATCEEFREESCIVADYQIDENGADVLGAQLAYKLFENYYGEKAKDEYIKLNKLSITHQQLFFYAAAYPFCTGQKNYASSGNTHNARNVRINALAQLPAFQEAFQCKPDSRMMKTVKKAVENVKISEVPESSLENIVQFFKNSCEQKKNTTSILKKIEEIVLKSKTKECRNEYCLTILADDTNCSRSASFLKERLLKTLKLWTSETYSAILSFKNFIRLRKADIAGISFTLGRNVLEGVDQVKTFIQEMVKILSDWIEQTPWLKNYDIKNYVQRLTSEIKHVDDMAIVLENDLDELMKEEINFLKCVHEVGDDGELFCLLYLFEFIPKTYKRNYYSEMNAFNRHPRVGFGYPLYHVAKNSEMSAKFGYVGLVVGHEIAHTLIEDPNKRQLMPVFSAESIQCIQDQFNATCEEFREESCIVADHQIDENGADVLGAQLAYKFFEDYYGEKAKDEYIKLNKLSITHQQLFFYATAYTLCSGQEYSAYPGDPHNTGNVRINALAQLPAFQEAFQCKPDSRMMKTVKKQCNIYGKDAPNQR